MSTGKCIEVSKGVESVLSTRQFSRALILTMKAAKSCEVSATVCCRQRRSAGLEHWELNVAQPCSGLSTDGCYACG